MEFARTSCLRRTKLLCCPSCGSCRLNISRDTILFWGVGGGEGCASGIIVVDIQRIYIWVVWCRNKSFVRSCVGPYRAGDAVLGVAFEMRSTIYTVRYKRISSLVVGLATDNFGSVECKTTNSYVVRALRQ